MLGEWSPNLEGWNYENWNRDVLSNDSEIKVHGLFYFRAKKVLNYIGRFRHGCSAVSLRELTSRLRARSG